MESSETTVDALIERYRGILFDAYGVLVTATGALPGAAAVIDRLNTLATPYYVVTNDASRLPETVARRLAAFGLRIPPERVITSGVLLTVFFQAHALIGRRCLVLGSRDSRRYELARRWYPSMRISTSSSSATTRDTRFWKP